MATKTKPKPSGKGRAQRAGSKRGAARSDKPVDYWRRPIAPQEIARDRFRCRLLRGKGKAELDLTNLVESFTWDDVSSTMTGTLTFRHPFPQRADISEGHVVVMEWSRLGTGVYRELWRMRVRKPTIEMPSAVVSATLMDDMAFLQLSKDDFVYNKDKAHPRGWTVHQIVSDICKRYGVRLGRIPRSKLRIKRFSKLNVSPLDAIIAVLRKLREDSDQKLVLRYERGRVIVEPLRRSKELLVMSRTLTQASYARTVYQKGFATVVTAKGTAKKGKGRSKLRVRVESKAARQRYGTVHKMMDSKGDTRAEVRRAAARTLAKMKDPERELTVQHSGIATLRRGHAIRVDLPEFDLKQVVFVKEVRHNVSGRNYEMSVTLRFDDPFVDDAAKSSKKKRAAAAKKKGRKTKDKKSSKERPKPKRAAARADR